MSGSETRASLQLSLAIEQQDFEFDAGVFQHRRGNFPSLRGDGVTQGGAVRQFEGFGGGVGAVDFCGDVRMAAGGFSHRRKAGKIHLAAFGVQIEPSLRELSHFCHAASDGDAGDRVGFEVFQHAADEVAHFEQSCLGKAVQGADGLLGIIAGAAGHMGEACSACHVDAAMDGMDPGGAGIGDDNSGGAKDGEPAHDAKTAVQRARGQSLAVGYGNFDRDVTGGGVLCGEGSDGGGDHLAWDWVDGGLAGRDGEARAGNRADAGAGTENYAGAGWRQSDGDADKCAMGNIRVVSRILHHRNGGGGAGLRPFGEGEGSGFSAGESDFHRVREMAGEDRGVGSFGRRRRASAGRPAAAQRGFGFHADWYTNCYRRGEA